MRTTVWVRILAGVGAVAVVLGVVGAVVLGAMIRRGFSSRDEPSAVEALIARKLRSWATPASLRGLKNPVQVDAAVLAEARAHWADHCATCHGNDGRGQTDFGRGLFPRAPDMRAPSTQELSDGELYAIIENGIRLSGMPAFGDGRPDNQASWALVAFVRHLPEQTDAELEEMKKLNPRSVHQQQEEAEEDAFLNEPAAPGSHDHRSHGEHK